MLALIWLIFWVFPVLALTEEGNNEESELQFELDCLLFKLWLNFVFPWVTRTVTWVNGIKCDMMCYANDVRTIDWTWKYIQTISRLAVGGKGNLLMQQSLYLLKILSLFIDMDVVGWMICLHLAILEFTSCYSTDVVKPVKLPTNVIRIWSFEFLHS